MGDRFSWLLVAPILVLTLTLNWAAIALAFSVLALVAWQQHRWGSFGAMVALGTTAKLFPLVFLAAGLILLLRRRSLRAVVKMILTFATFTVGANAPLYLSKPDAWAEFWRTSTDRSAVSGPRGLHFGWSGSRRARSH